MFDVLKSNRDVSHYLSKELKKDKKFFAKIVKDIDGYFLMHASDEVKNDKTVVLDAVKSCGSALEYASDELKSDRDVVLSAVNNNGCALKYASDELKNDKEVVLIAVKNIGIALNDASENLKNDKEIVLEAVKSDAFALTYIGDRLRKDIGFIVYLLDLLMKKCENVGPFFLDNDVILNIEKMYGDKYNDFIRNYIEISSYVEISDDDLPF